MPLLVTGGDVLLFRHEKLNHMTALVNRYTKAPCASPRVFP